MLIVGACTPSEGRAESTDRGGGDVPLHSPAFGVTWTSRAFNVPHVQDSRSSAAPVVARGRRHTPTTVASGKWVRTATYGACWHTPPSEIRVPRRSASLVFGVGCAESGRRRGWRWRWLSEHTGNGGGRCACTPAASLRSPAFPRVPRLAFVVAGVGVCVFGFACVGVRSGEGHAFADRNL